MWCKGGILRSSILEKKKIRIKIVKPVRVYIFFIRFWVHLDGGIRRGTIRRDNNH